jgi:hypothetical protein
MGARGPDSREPRNPRNRSRCPFSGSAFEVKQPGVTQTEIYQTLVDNETFYAWIQGGDGDEHGYVTIDVDTSKHSRYTAEERQEFAEISSDYNHKAARMTAIASAIPYPFSIPFSELAAYYWDQSQTYADMANDPSDPNFTTVAAPQPVTVPPIQAGGGINQAGAAAFNALFSEQAQALGLGRAIGTAIDRAQGASDAGNSAFENLQLQAATQYTRQLGALGATEPALSASLRAALIAGGLADQTATASDIGRLQSDVASAGLPAGLVQALQQIGTTDAQLEDIEIQLITQSASDAAGSLYGTLADASFAALRQVAQDMTGTVLLAGSLAPESDTGAANWDGLTNVATPTFAGTAPAGTTVQLFAKRSDQSAPVSIGQTVADGSGSWRLTTSHLDDGSYAISAKFIGGGAGAGAGQSTPLTRIVIDSVAPRVVGVAYNRMTGVVTVMFDDPTGLNLTTLTSPGADTARRGKGKRAPAIKIRGLHALDSRTVAFTVGKGRSHPGSFSLEIRSAAILDQAGNALDGEVTGALPSGDGHAGGDFLASIPFRTPKRRAGK